jgi:cytochrome c peroxidase
MKTNKVFILLTVVCFFTLSVNKLPKKRNLGLVIEKVQKLYTSNFIKFQNQVNTIVSQINDNDLEAIKSQLVKTRLAYKEIEFVLGYYQTSYNATFINGAPLPKISEFYNAGKVIEPSGLQVLDELIFEKEGDVNIQQIKKIAQNLKERVDFLAKIHFPVTLKESQIIETIRSGIVRIFTLGVTGFDTPGGCDALAESYVSLQSMESTFLCFEAQLNPNEKSHFNNIKKLFKKGKRLLSKAKDFNSFNRMEFLKVIVNPLYGELLEFQNSNGVILEPFKRHAQNYKTKNLFSQDFLNTDFYSEFVYLPLDNSKTISLGKMLFEDTNLSNGNEMSCVNCHNSNLGFGDGLPKSATNKEGVFTARNSPTVMNAGYSTRYFWDMREFNLEKQVAHVIDNDLEFNTSFNDIINKLSRNPIYIKLFKEAYAGISKRDINQRSISNAIAAYVNSLKSLNSPFDKYVRNEIDDYPENAKRGFNLFTGKAACATCHFAPIFNGTIPPFYLESESEVLGVTKGFDTINPIKDEDLGRSGNGLFVDNHPFFENSFKTVSLRNIAITGPYMHNGLFNTLEEVLEFYNLGGGVGMGLDIENQTLSDEPLNLSNQEKSDIIAFMKTLTDTSGFGIYSD